MKNIFEELWYGRLDPYTECKNSRGDAEMLKEYIERHRKNLSETLTEAQKQVFEKLDDCYVELNDINERTIFSYAFKLGARLAIEISDESI